MFDILQLKKELGELPYDKKERLIKEYGLLGNKAIFLTINNSICEFFEKTILEIKKIINDQNKIDQAINLVYNYLVTDILGGLTLKNISFNDLKITPISFSKLIELIINDRISSRGAKIILEKMIECENDPERIMKDNNLEQVSNDDLLQKMISEVLSENIKSVEEYRSGKVTVLQFLIGKTMAKAKGAGNPGKIKEMIEKELSK
jgi:aspartyl-tRNA(Asn)/glutamyl-tRNA(Gln) amidotransferase subunit B